jgi:hypothetical protein
MDHAWRMFTALFRWYRIMGIASLSVIAYLLVFVVFRKTDVSWLLPPSSPPGIPRFQWPDLPYFTVDKETASDGRHEETIYTVPTRQITPQEVASLTQTNRGQPAAPRQPVAAPNTGSGATSAR